MKTTRIAIGTVPAIVASVRIFSASAAETKPASERIGIYDSRVVAYAHFWTEPHQRDLNERAKTAKDAKAAGQTARYEELSASLKQEQERIHRQVFSTAPIDNVLADIKDRLPASVLRVSF